MTILTVGGAALMAGFWMGWIRKRCTRCQEKRPDPADGKNRAVPLRSFFWRQLHTCADGCFVLSFDRRLLTCEFQTADGGEIRCEDAPVTAAQWQTLEALVRPLDLPPYAPPDENLLDAVDSQIRICWEEPGGCRTEQYQGNFCGSLFAALAVLAAEIADQPGQTERQGLPEKADAETGFPK